MLSDNQRFLSIDVFRGIDVALMIVVNSLGSHSTAYSPLLHAKWNGFTLTDLVFPTFLFVVGNSLALSLPKYQALGASAVLSKIGKRTLLIFLLGILLGWFPFVRYNDAGEWTFKALENIRVFGVLQRIALGYGLAALIIYFFKPAVVRWFCALALLGYWILLHLFGDLSLEGNAVIKLDAWLIGTTHMYKGEGIPFDPEGLFSTLPAIVNVIAGYWAVQWLIKKSFSLESLLQLCFVGALLIAGSCAWDLVFPWNKKLWSSSYVLLTVGIDLIVLAFLSYVIDYRKKAQRTYFLEVFGKNTLVIYIFSGVFVKLLLLVRVGDQSLYSWAFETLIASWLGRYHGSGVFGVLIMLFCWVIGWWMDKKKIYIRV
jgi:predicted acyltransferase